MTTTDLTIPSTATELAAVMAEYGDQEDNDARFRSGVDERKLTPFIQMTKESTDFNIKVGEETVDTRKVLYVSFLDVYGTRVLFPPEADKEKWGTKQPVCSVGFVDPAVLQSGTDSATGKWKINEHYAAPYDTGMQHQVGDMVSFQCAKCPWNRFETKLDWERKEGTTKAKACSEHRTLFVKLMTKGPAMPVQGEELHFFEVNDQIDRFALLTVSMGTNRKAVQELYLKAQARKLSMKAAVFKLTVRHDMAGSFKYAVLVPEFAGIATPKAYREVLKPIAAETLAFARRNSNTIVTDAEIPI